MTLKEKFTEAFKSGKRFDIENAEQVADEFAIGFADWIWGNCFNIFNDSFLYKDDEYSTKELLEIYKKTL